MIGNPRLPKSTALYNQLFTDYPSKIEQFNPEYQDQIREIFIKTEDILSGITSVEKRMYSSDKWQYIYHQTDQFVDHSEFESVAQPGTRWLIT